MKKVSALFMLLVLCFSVSLMATANDLESFNFITETIIQSVEGAEVVTDITMQFDVSFIIIGNIIPMHRPYNNSDEKFLTSRASIAAAKANYDLRDVESQLSNTIVIITGFRRWIDHPSFKGIN